MPLTKVRPQDWSVLRVIHRLGAIPQQRLAEQIGRQPSTVNGAVQRLVAAGWLERVGRTGSGRGRPAILLAVNRAVACFGGVDLAAGRMHCAVVAADGTLLGHVSANLSDDKSPAAVLDQIDLNLRGLLARFELRAQQLLGVWAGINGAVDETGTVVSCAALHWHNVPLGRLLSERFHCDALVQGGATVMNAAAEALMGVGRNVESLVYFHAGRGISARFVERGRPLSGATQRAGELGHVVVAPGGARCACGNDGCLEAVASGPAILAALRRAPRDELPEPLRRMLRSARRDGAAPVVQAAFKCHPHGAHDPLAALLKQITNYLAMGAAMAVAAYDPRLLILGGYLFEDNPTLYKDVAQALRRMVLDWDKRDLKVVKGEVVTQDRAVAGAAEVCQRFWANPRGVVAAR